MDAGWVRHAPSRSGATGRSEDERADWQRCGAEAARAVTQPLVVVAAGDPGHLPRAVAGALERRLSQPGRPARTHGRRRDRAPGARSRDADAHQPGPSPPQRVPGRRRHLGRHQRRPAARPAARLLLRRVRPPSFDPDLLRRPRGAGRRPPEEHERPGRAGGRRRPALPRRLRPPADRRRRLAAGPLRADRRRGAAGRALAGSGRRAAALRRRAARQGRLPAGLARAGGPRRPAAARRPRRGELGGRSRSDRAALRRRPGDPHPAGDPARRRRLSRPRQARHPAFGAAPQRGALRLRAAGMGAPAGRARGADRRRGAAPGAVGERLHHPHAGAGGSRPFPGGPRPAPSRAARGRSRDAGVRGDGARLGSPVRLRRAVSADRAGAAALPPLERRLGAARPGVPPDVDGALPRARRGSRADRPHHQRRARAHLAGTGSAGWGCPNRRRRRSTPRR